MGEREGGVGANDGGLNLDELPVRYEEPLAEWPSDQIALLQRVDADVFILKLRFVDSVGCVQFRLREGEQMEIQDSADR